MTTYLYGYGTPPKNLTVAQLEVRPDWAKLHPEFRRRLLALFDASNGTVGHGGGWRSSEAQRALFLGRYTRTTVPTAIVYDGSYWVKNPGVAAAAPPNLSYHESTVDGYGVAADLIGDLSFVAAHCAAFDLIEFSHVNREPWHVQPTELPTSRRTYNSSPSSFPLHVWNPAPAPEPTPPPTEDDDMSKPIFIGVEGSAGQFLYYGAGTLPLAFPNPAQRDLMLAAYGLDANKGTTISAEMFNRLVDAAG